MEFKCPICGNVLKSISGNGIDKNNGITLYCSIKDLTICNSNEAPFGHGKNEKDAYETLCQKYVKNN